MLLTKSLVKLYEKKLGINNVQLINSSGSEAQQDVNHFHIHVLPRATDDGNDINWNIKPKVKEEFNILKSKFLLK